MNESANRGKLAEPKKVKRNWKQFVRNTLVWGSLDCWLFSSPYPQSFASSRLKTCGRGWTREFWRRGRPWHLITGGKFAGSWKKSLKFNVIISNCYTENFISHFFQWISFFCLISWGNISLVISSKTSITLLRFKNQLSLPSRPIPQNELPEGLKDGHRLQICRKCWRNINYFH